MNKKFLIIIFVLIIILTAFFIKKSDNDEIINNSETGNKTYHNVIINEETGETEYVIYNSLTNEEITRVSENEKYKLDIYEADPDFEELESPEGEFLDPEIMPETVIE